jgi:CHAD domain-containing protein
MLRHLMAFFEMQNPESLHRFRIKVKKMKALLLFLQEGVREKYETGHLVSLQSIFKHAGRIRNAHINIGLLIQYPVTDSSYKIEQENIEKSEIYQFCAKRNAYMKSVKLISKAPSDAFRDIDDKYILTLYKKRIKKLARFFERPDLNIDQLHKTRKKIKNLLYLYRILPKSLARKLDLNDAYLEHLQEAIGKWHDVVLLLELLKTEGYENRSEIARMHREKGVLYRSVQTLSNNFGRKVGKVCP